MPAILPAQRRRLLETTAFWFVVLSALYFVDTLLRAMLKTFWFDELVTVYLCRLPTFHATWTAVLHGCDLNPPLFYLMTRACERVFGEGLIATRLPAVLGFWIFSICLYAFTSRRLGRTGGCIAALAPFFTLAHNYAYEARAHGAVLGYCGLMLVCWQRARERTLPGSWLINSWTLGLGASFLSALLTHVYALYLAVPFLLIEAGNFLTKRRVHRGVLIVLLLPMLPAALVYIPLFHAYRALVAGPQPGFSLVDSLQSYWVATYGPVLSLAVVGLVAFASRPSGQGAPAPPPQFALLSRDELAVGILFLLLPVIGGFGIVLTQGPFFNRYFLSSTTGFALLLAQIASMAGDAGRISRILVTTMVFFLACDAMMSLFYRWQHFDLRQVEPASYTNFPKDPDSPLSRSQSLPRKPDLDILVTGGQRYFYLHYYAPPALGSRLIFATPDPDDTTLTYFRSLVRWANVDLAMTTYNDFFAAHREFMVYSNTDGHFNGSCLDCLEKFLDAGYTLRSVQRDDDGLLEHFSR